MQLILLNVKKCKQLRPLDGGHNYLNVVLNLGGRVCDKALDRSFNWRNKINERSESIIFRKPGELNSRVNITTTIRIVESADITFFESSLALLIIITFPICSYACIICVTIYFSTKF